MRSKKGMVLIFMNYGVTEQEFDSALHKLKKMAATGKTTGEELATLGDMIFYGYSQHESNAEQAMPYWEMALAKGYAIETEKMVAIALSLKDGERGFAVDEEKSLRYMQMAADKGNVTAEYYSGLWYLQKMDRDPQAEGPGMIYLAKAALQNDADAQFLLGVSMLELKGKPEHRGHFSFEYLQWLILAEINGSEDAAKELTAIAGTDSDMAEVVNRLRTSFRREGGIPPKTSQVFEIYGAKSQKQPEKKKPFWKRFF